MQHPRLNGAHPVLRSNQQPFLASLQSGERGYVATDILCVSDLFVGWVGEGKEKEVPDNLILFAGRIQRFL